MLPFFDCGKLIFNLKQDKKKTVYLDGSSLILSCGKVVGQLGLEPRASGLKAVALPTELLTHSAPILAGKLLEASFYSFPGSKKR